jgi:DNA segregation ATPase FtsK/SpoIIIE, S-DNA-T family
VNLWIGFSDASKMPAAAYPLVKSGTADVFGQVPFGTDPRQRPVTSGLFELNYLIGAAPGQGKTGTVRVLAAAAALDVVADLWTNEFSGKGDLEALAKISHRYVGGLDDEIIAYGAESLARLRAELERRSTVFKKIPRDQRPDGKLTPDLAARKSIKLRPVVAIFDECQNLFMHPKHGKQAAEDAAYIIRLGRAYGIILVLATQRPDKDSLPTSVSGIVTARFCLSVPDQLSNDMILGTSSYSAGYNSTLFRPKTDAGWGWPKGEGTAQTVRTYYLDLPAFERIIQRARVLREHAGVLSGYALGEDDGTEARSFAADVAAVFGTDDRLWCDTIAARLAGSIPGAYANITRDAVASQLRTLGVEVKNVRERGEAPRKGCDRTAVETVAGGANA